MVNVTSAVLHVGDVARDAGAATRCTGVDAVKSEASVFCASAMRREQEHRRTKLNLPVTGDDAGHELKDVVIRARRRDRVQHIAVDDLLTSGALDIHDRRLACHRYRFLEFADTKIDVNGCGERAGEHDAFALDDVESLQGERE